MHIQHTSVKGAHHRHRHELEIAGQHQHIGAGGVEFAKHCVAVRRIVDHCRRNGGLPRALQRASIRPIRADPDDLTDVRGRTSKMVDQRLQVGAAP